MNRFYSAKSDVENVFSHRKAEFQWFHCLDFVRFYGTCRPGRADGWIDWGMDRQSVGYVARGEGGRGHD